jgi:D-beta-D-heptose 7-phosphate kinase/D-beta-D-heptose 1-phosphate adenosyltransferase
VKGIIMKEKPTILVIGDIMLDKYTIVGIDRVSPEAPVLVGKVAREYSTLGGCGNVVRNLRKIGITTLCLSAIGNDPDGEEVKKQLFQVCKDDSYSIPFLITTNNRTTVKQRIVATERQTQMLRVDYEDTTPIPFNLFTWFLEEKVSSYKVDIVIISDYAKGVVSWELMHYLKSKGYKIIVDPKPEHGVMYNGVFMITPNEKEWDQMWTSSAYVHDKVDYFLVTKGSKGMELYKNNRTSDIIPGQPVEVYNPSGAGDTVVAVVSACIAEGLSPLDSAKVANMCAAYVVTKPGTTAVSKEVFERSLNEVLRQYKGLSKHL